MSELPSTAVVARECFNCGKSTSNHPKVWTFTSQGQPFDEITGSLCDECLAKLDWMKNRWKRKKVVT